MSSILITGGCGFIGSNLARALAADGHEVTCFDNLSRRGSEVLLKTVLAAGCRFVHGDIRCPADFDRVPGSPGVMIECSAEPSVLVGMEGRDARRMLDINLVGSLNCFEWARAQRAGVIFLSTSRVYPYDAINRIRFAERESRFEPAERQPGLGPDGLAEDFPLEGARSLYGATKLASEIVLQEYSRSYDLPVLINRLGVVAGPGQLGRVDQGIFAFWLAAHYFQRPLRYIGFGGQGKQVRDVLHIADVCDLVRRQVARLGEFRGEIFNAGGSTAANLSLLETTRLCREITGHQPPVETSGENRPADVIWYVTDNRRVTSVFGWKPTRPARQVLADFHEWLARNEADFRAVLT